MRPSDGQKKMATHHTMSEPPELLLRFFLYRQKYLYSFYIIGTQETLRKLFYPGTVLKPALVQNFQLPTALKRHHEILQPVDQQGVLGHGNSQRFISKF